MGGKAGFVKKLVAAERKDGQPRTGHVGQVWVPVLLANSSRKIEGEGEMQDTSEVFRQCSIEMMRDIPQCQSAPQNSGTQMQHLSIPSPYQIPLLRVRF